MKISSGEYAERVGANVPGKAIAEEDADVSDVRDAGDERGTGATGRWGREPR